jgi:hypothetical protein
MASVKIDPTVRVGVIHGVAPSGFSGPRVELCRADRGIHDAYLEV